MARASAHTHTHTQTHTRARVYREHAMEDTDRTTFRVQTIFVDFDRF